MAKKPECFGHFMENIGNPNCDICYLASKCYQVWSEKDKLQQAVEDNNVKPWNKRKPLAEIYPEILCDKCG